jgi:virginiamycin B lyase
MNLRCIGAVLIILLAGCAANHSASPSSVIRGAPNFAPQDGFNPFNLNTKNVIQKYPLPTPNSAPLNMATGSDKNVWFTEQGAPRIGEITTAGLITEYAIPSGVNAADIAPGAAGTVWFTEYTSTIGKINTTTGHISEFPNPGSQGPITGIVKGSDGNMWFADQTRASIGKITPTGTITEYSLYPNYPGDIAAGPDGNLWFTEVLGSGSVGRITTSGIITEYPVNIYTFAIAAGPDGNLYATGAAVLKITTAGGITAFSAGYCGSPTDIILGPDKQMWIACGGGAFQEFNPKTDAFSATITPGSGQLGGLTLGGDGDVWIADNAGNSILVYEEKVTTIGIRLNGELSFMDPNYGFELGYAVGTSSTQTQTISLGAGESVKFKNVDTIPHSAAFLGNATANSAPWPPTFIGSTTKSPAGTAIGTTGWATGSLNANKTSPIYETGLPGFYMIGDQYDYVSNNMRTVIIVH